MGQRYAVAWPHASIHLDGKDLVLAKGEFLPDAVPRAHADMLASFGAVVLVSGAADTSGAPSSPATETPAGPPAKGAQKAAWVDWAVSQGADRADASKLKKPELIEQYGDDATAASEPGAAEPDADGAGEGDSPDVES